MLILSNENHRDVSYNLYQSTFLCIQNKRTPVQCFVGTELGPVMRTVCLQFDENKFFRSGTLPFLCLPDLLVPKTTGPTSPKDLKCLSTPLRRHVPRRRQEGLTLSVISWNYPYNTDLKTTPTHRVLTWSSSHGNLLVVPRVTDLNRTLSSVLLDWFFCTDYSWKELDFRLNKKGSKDMTYSSVSVKNGNCFPFPGDRSVHPQVLVYFD